MKRKIPLTDESMYGFMLDSLPIHDPRRRNDTERPEPVIVFFDGLFAYEFVSDEDVADFGRLDKYEFYVDRLINGIPIEISSIKTVRLESEIFRMEDGRHRAVVLALRNEILAGGSFLPTLYPKRYVLEAVPFLTTRESAEVMKAKGWLVPPSADFEMRSCRSRIFQ